MIAEPAAGTVAAGRPRDLPKSDSFTSCLDIGVSFRGPLAAGERHPR